MGNLEVLYLSGTHVTDKGLRHLHALGNLRRLALRNNNVTAAGIGRLKQALPNCIVLR